MTVIRTDPLILNVMVVSCQYHSRNLLVATLPCQTLYLQPLCNGQTLAQQIRELLEFPIGLPMFFQ